MRSGTWSRLSASMIVTSRGRSAGIVVEVADEDHDGLAQLVLEGDPVRELEPGARPSSRR